LPPLRDVPMATTSRPTTALVAPELGLTMTQVLRNPLAALRASMETLASEFRADDPRSTRLRGVLEQVLEMSRDVDALVRLTTPRAVVALECSTEEVLRTTLRRLRFDQVSRVQLANAAVSTRLVTDAPMLSDCLARLLDEALADSGDQVLVSARVEADHACFSIVGGSGHGRPGGDRDHLPPNRNAALELGLLLARRDLERLEARLDVAHTSLGHTCVLVRVPLQGARAPSGTTPSTAPAP
jgi:K+-sensing histidine kinase KdpD